MRPQIAGGFMIACGLAVMIGACSSQPGGTSPAGPTPPSNPQSTSTITIANNAVSPKNIIVPLGSQVTFVNNDNRPHDMESDPHPEHTDCPALAQVGFLNPGQSRQSGNLTVARVCGFHDHIQPDVASMLGSITIQ